MPDKSKGRNSGKEKKPRTTPKPANRPHEIREREALKNRSAL